MFPRKIAYGVYSVFTGKCAILEILSTSLRYSSAILRTVNRKVGGNFQEVVAMYTFYLIFRHNPFRDLYVTIPTLK